MESDGYGGIFAGAANSCSVPFLDIPPSSHCSDSQIIDYSEIFGGSNGDGDFALIDYEELIKASKKKTEGSSDSSNARISTEANLSQQFVEASLFPEENLGDCSMKNSSSSSSDYNNDTLKQFSMSYHGLSHDSREDFVSGKRCITQLRAIPGYSIVIDSCSSLANVQHDSSVQIQTNDLLHSVSSDGRLNDAELGKEESHTSSTDNTKSYKDDMNTNQKDFTTKLKHYSQSSSSYLTSSVDLSYPSVTYVSAYDINLRTKPSNVPPPSRAPPKLFSKQESSKMKTCRSSKGDQEEGNILKPVPNHQIHYRVGVSKSGRFDGEAKDTNSRFFEADEDASSAAAAMKEAMEQAQAKLRSAKELMERQQDNLPSRKKQGHKETTKYNEIEIQTSEKGKIFHDGITKKSLLKDMNKVKKYALDDIKNVVTTEKKEVYVVKAEESQPPRQGNGYNSSQRPYKSEELHGDQKTEKQFYELANNEKFRVLKEAFKHEGVERKPKTATDFCEDRHEGNANVEMGDDNSIAGNITLKEDIGEKPNSFLETCFLKEIVSKLEEEDHSFNPQYKNEKIKADQESLIRERKLMAQYSSENMSLRGMSQKNDGFSSDALKLEEIYQDNEENGNSQVAEEACLRAVSVKKLSGTNLTSLSESEEKSNVNMLDSHLSSYGENKCKLEATISASEQKESRKLDGEFMQVENDLESMLPQDENEMIENSEITKEMKSTEVIWPDFAETIEATWERLQNKKKADASKVLSVKKNTVKPRDSADRESKEGHEAARTSQNFVPGVHKTEKAEKEGTIGVERELEKVTARKTEEEKERQMEREKDRGTVEKAADEAHERALSEARERFGRIAVERGTAEVQQKALAFKLKEAKLRAGRAAVERALAEARELAVKKALDEIAAADARKRAEKLSATSREKGRKENESGDIFGDCDGEVTETRLKAGPSNVLHDARFLNTGSSSSSQRHADSYPHGEVESPLRFKARLERHQRTSDRAAKALAEKNMRDVLVQREQAERNRFAESLDGEIRRWATGKEGNLRALVSTLQYILGPESGWQPIPLTDVITAAAVKKAYRKATLCVHPDKLQQRGANVQQKYICEKVFDLLKDAWSQFNSEER